LDNPAFPIPFWRTNPEDVTVRVLPKDRFLEVIYIGTSAKNKKSVEFDSSKIQIMLDGQLRQPRTTSLKRYTEFIWGTSLTLEINTGADLPETVIIDTRPKAILVNGEDYPIPRMIFRRATRTTTMLTRPLNC
jgi:hypothetical protein